MEAHATIFKVEGGRAAVCKFAAEFAAACGRVLDAAGAAAGGRFGNRLGAAGADVATAGDEGVKVRTAAAGFAVVREQRPALPDVTRPRLARHNLLIAKNSSPF